MEVVPGVVASAAATATTNVNENRTKVEHEKFNLASPFSNAASSIGSSSPHEQVTSTTPIANELCANSSLNNNQVGSNNAANRSPLTPHSADDMTSAMMVCESSLSNSSITNVASPSSSTTNSNGARVRRKQACPTRYANINGVEKRNDNCENQSPDNSAMLPSPPPESTVNGESLTHATVLLDAARSVFSGIPSSSSQNSSFKIDNQLVIGRTPTSNVFELEHYCERCNKEFINAFYHKFHRAKFHAEAFDDKEMYESLENVTSVSPQIKSENNVSSKSESIVKQENSAENVAKKRRRSRKQKKSKALEAQSAPTSAAKTPHTPSMPKDQPSSTSFSSMQLFAALQQQQQQQQSQQQQIPFGAQNALHPLFASVLNASNSAPREGAPTNGVQASSHPLTCAAEVPNQLANSQAMFLTTLLQQQQRQQQQMFPQMIKQQIPTSQTSPTQTSNPLAAAAASNAAMQNPTFQNFIARLQAQNQLHLSAAIAPSSQLSATPTSSQLCEKTLDEITSSSSPNNTADHVTSSSSPLNAANMKVRISTQSQVVSEANAVTQSAFNPWSQSPSLLQSLLRTPDSMQASSQILPPSQIMENSPINSIAPGLGFAANIQRLLEERLNGYQMQVPAQNQVKSENDEQTTSGQGKTESSSDGAQRPEIYRCGTCGLDFISKIFLDQHKFAEHSAEGDENSHGSAKKSKSNEEKPVDPFKVDPEAFCEMCKKEFCSKYFLKTHKMKVHAIPMEAQNSAEMRQFRHQVLDEMRAQAAAEIAAKRAQQQAESFAAAAKSGILPNVPGFAVPSTSSPRMPAAKNYCDMCNKELCNKYFLKTHMQKMHSIIIEDEPGKKKRKKRKSMKNLDPSLAYSGGMDGMSASMLDSSQIFSAANTDEDDEQGFMMLDTDETDDDEEHDMKRFKIEDENAVTCVDVKAFENLSGEGVSIQPQQVEQKEEASEEKINKEPIGNSSSSSPSSASHPVKARIKSLLAAAMQQQQQQKQIMQNAGETANSELTLPNISPQPTTESSTSGEAIKCESSDTEENFITDKSLTPTQTYSVERSTNEPDTPHLLNGSTGSGSSSAASTDHDIASTSSIGESEEQQQQKYRTQLLQNLSAINPALSKQYMTQAFVLSLINQGGMGMDTSDLVPSVVYLPVKKKLRQPITASFTLTPADYMYRE